MKMKSNPSKGVRISQQDNIRTTVLKFLTTLLENRIFDGILIPIQVPAGNSYAWILVKDPSLFKRANPLPPIMPVQGAKALKSLTRKGKGNLQILALMRPCEIRASVELAKLNQVHLENITLMSVDCPGALPMSDYIKDPKQAEQNFAALMENQWGDHSTKPVCQNCDRFSMIPSVDLHIGLLTGHQNAVFLVPNSQKGHRVIKDIGLKASASLLDWKKNIEEITRKRKTQRSRRFQEVKSMVKGFEGLLETFASCIGCRNCQSACPICYCRHCYFESEVSKLEQDFILQKAERRGGLSFPLDKRMFHVGRMSHMSLSCVSCGLCSDACPVSIPVAEIFSYVADQTQQTFEYHAGINRDQALPIQQYRIEEIRGVQALVKEAEIVEHSDG
jgi:formate dehydrogenase subunit beta